jgi:hypothetical protein
MPPPDRPPTQPDMPASAKLLWPRPRPCDPDRRAMPARTAAVILVKRNTPFSPNKINVLCRGARSTVPLRSAGFCPRARNPYPAADVMHTDRSYGIAARIMRPPFCNPVVLGRLAIPYLDKIFPVLARKFPASGGTGNWLQVIESAYDRLAKPSLEA